MELSLSNQSGETSLSLQLQEPLCNRVNNTTKDGYVVGWPPVGSWRKLRRRVRAANYVNVGNGRVANSLYVKVKMEGVGITRKIDLSLYRSHRTLANNLIALFGKCEENVTYKLMYQNKEGEWHQARDVPWECFIKSVGRLKLEKNGNSSYLS